MAVCAILYVCDAFVAVLGNDARLLVLMTAITGVALVIAAKVTGRAGRVVFSVKLEKAAVIERRWLPARRLMTGRASQSLCPVPIIAWRNVARLTVFPGICLQKRMVKPDGTGPGQLWPGMIVVAGHAVRIGQGLMECRSSFSSLNLGAFGSS